jgi:YidC/Oxa1 family membrane protein insertase
MAEYKSPQSEPGMDQNVLLVFLLMAVVIFGAQFFMRKYAPPQTSNLAPAQKPVPPIAPPPGGMPQTATASSPSAQKISGKQQMLTKQAESEAEIVVENDLYRITFTNRGAQAKSWVLKKFQDDQAKPLDMVNTVASAKYGNPLSLWTYDESMRNKLNSVLYLPSTREARLQAPAQIQFDYASGGLSVRKTFRFDSTYVVAVETAVFFNDSPVSAYPAWPAAFGDQTNLAAYAAGQIEYQVNNDTEHIAAKKISGGNTLHGTYDWVGASSTYFGAVFIPDQPEELSIVTLHNAIDIVPDPSKPNESKPADIVGVAVGRAGEFRGRLFVGPKAVDVLDSISVPTISGADKDLRSMLNFGWFGWIARPLFAWPYIGLRWYYRFVHNWGWAIVVQTLIISFLLLPLRVKQMHWSLKMQKIQPQIKAIQEKYKKYSMRDPRKQEMQKEIFDLQKQEGVSQFGGCLPMLVQLPFLFAYYRMLSAAIELRQAHWLWIHDLSSSDLILPLLMALSMFVVQKMTPQPGVDPAQQKMMTVMMPVMMGVFFFRLPAGLNLYYALSNGISIAQQAVMNRTKLGREIREIQAKRTRKKDK